MEQRKVVAKRGIKGAPARRLKEVRDCVATKEQRRQLPPGQLALLWILGEPWLHCQPKGAL